MSKPRIVVSRCLGFEACRYNGEIIHVSWLSELEQVSDIITVCPELMAGLGIPRTPINLFKVDGEIHVIQDDTGIDYTEIIATLSREFLSSLGKIDGFVLKSKSPSCGLESTKVRSGDSFYLASGVFAQKALEIHPDAVFVDESKLDSEGVEVFIDSL